MICSFFAALLLLNFNPALCRSSNQVGVNNKVDGDQTVGGMHLFEMHTPEGGMGLGLSLIHI